jgi:NTP pyrophosphatase (non-canonical NTP hydrolase)
MFIDYADMVRKLNKPGQDIIDSLTPEKAQLWHMACGVAGEAGELLDAIKKHVVYGKPIDIANVIEELGDLEFFMEGVRQLVRVKREETMAANVTKLAARYEDAVYSDKAAILRADKA